jgi:hypothetical protein
MGYGGVLLVEWLLPTILFVVPTWLILRKAGFIPALSLLLIVPLLGWLCLTIVLAFVEWPALKRRTHADLAATFE